MTLWPALQQALRDALARWPEVPEAIRRAIEVLLDELTQSNNPLPQ
jgi:hypothetical protein